MDVVPLKPQSKELQPGYGARPAHFASLDFARQWFVNTDANLGVVLGGPTGLIVADWNDAHPYESWRATTGAAVETLTEQTARGYHVFFTCPGLRTNVSHGCELEATGVCMVAPSGISQSRVGLSSGHTQETPPLADVGGSRTML